jgi:hypothetical protein
MHPLTSRAQNPKHPKRRWLMIGLAVTLLGLSAGIGAIISTAATSHPNSVFGLLARPSNPSAADAKPVEVGMKFKALTDVNITSLRFFKGKDNTGTHTGSIWTMSGQRLVNLTYGLETASGWQNVVLPSPLFMAAGTTYVVSYHTDSGHYSYDGNYFGGSYKGDGPVQALTDGENGPNGVYAYGTSAFPTSGWKAANYWVDIAFASVAGQTTTTLAASAPTTTTTAAPTTTTTTAAQTTTTTAAQTTTTAAPPTTITTVPPTPLGGTPGAGNTGVPAGTVLTPLGGYTVTTPGAVIDAKDISGQVTIAAANVTIRRSRFTGGNDQYAIYVRSGSVRVEDSEFRGGYHTAAIAFDNWVGVRLNVHDMPDDGFKLGSNATLQDSWVHDFTPESGAHADGLQMQNGVTNSNVIHNFINIAGNAALFLAPDLGPTTNGPLLVDGNILGGGNYTLYNVDGNNGQYFVHNITIRNNRFLRTYRYGPVDQNVPSTWTNNVWNDTGVAIAP